MAGARHHISGSLGLSLVEQAGQQQEVRRIEVGPGYLEIMGLRLDRGRFFRTDQTAGQTGAVVINQTLAAALNWTDPVGQRLLLDDEDVTVIGVVSDFHYNSFSELIRPVVFRVVDEPSFRYLVVRCRPGARAAVTAALDSA